MLKVVSGAALGAASLLGWMYWSEPIGDLTAAEAREVSAVLAGGYGGRAAVLQEPVVKKPDSSGSFVCGWVRIGGASSPLGAQSFAGLITQDGEFKLASLAVTKAEENAVRDVCAHRGLRL